MPDRKLTDPLFPLGTAAALLYGEESSVSNKYAGDAIFNVKNNYGGFGGAKGDGTTDDRPAIQAAINAAITATGGTVFFPRGVYKINSALTVPASSNYGIMLRGSGSPGSGSAMFGWGTVITGNFQDYLIRTLHLAGGTSPGDESPLGAIEDIGFNNTFNLGANINSTQAPGDTISPGNAHGCLYITTEAKFIIRNCTGTFVTGIGLYCTAQSLRVVDCSFTGGFSGTNAGRSIGVFINNGIITGGTIGNCGIAAMQAVNGSGSIGIENIDCEINGCVVVAGYSTIPFFSIDNTSIQAAGTSTCDMGFMRKVQGESNGDTDGSGLGANVYFGNVSNFDMVACKFANLTTTTPYGLRLGMVNHSTFSGCHFAGNSTSYSVAAVGFLGKVTGCRFSGMRAISGTGAGGVNWGPYNAPFDPGDDGNIFENCNNDQALALSLNFPTLPVTNGQVHYITDGNDPAWTGAVSNVGMPVCAGLTTNAPTAAGAGSRTLHFVAVPTWIGTGAGWKVFDPSVGAIPGGATIVSKTATTIVISADVMGGGVASGAAIAVCHGGGSNKVLLRWSGDYTNTATGGTWSIAG